MEQKSSGMAMLLCFALAVLVALIVALPLYGSSYQTTQFQEPSFALSEGWILEDMEGNFYPIQMPYSLPDGNTSYMFHFAFAQMPPISGAPALLLRMANVAYDLYVNGDLVYQYPERPFAISRTVSKALHFVKLPPIYSGELLTLVVKPLLKNDVPYKVGTPIIGDETSLAFHLVYDELPFLAILVLIIIASGILLILYRFLPRTGTDNSFLYICLFAIIFSIYALLTTRTFQLAASNSYLTHMATNLIMTLVSIPAMMIFYDSVEQRFQQPIRILCYLSALNFVAQIVLSFGGILDLRLMIPITHALILTQLIIMLYFFIQSARKPNPKLRRLLITSILPIIGIVVDIARFALLPPAEYPAMVFLVGMFFFIAVQIILFIRDYFTLYQEKVQAEWLQRLAYTDMLTGMQNRNAYEMRLSELDRHPDAHATIWCAVADINNLKQINDTMGHSCGDELIVGAAGLLREAFAEPAEIFRIGGDEFVVLMPDVEATFTKGCLAQLAELTEHHNRQVAIPVSMAMGIDCLQTEDRDLSALIARVDGLMYEDKERMRRANPTARRAQGSIAPQP